MPESLQEVTLEQYQKFLKLNTVENEGTPFMLQKMVEIFCRLDLKDVATIKYKYVKEIVEHLNSLFEGEQKLIKQFSLNGVRYGFIPQLDEMTLGEYVDLDTYLGDWDKMHKAMSVLYRPVTYDSGGRYQITEYKGTNDDLKLMPLDVVLGSLLFFYRLNKELLTATLNYLSKEMENEITTDQRQRLEQSGVGINQSMALLREILPSSVKL